MLKARMSTNGKIYTRGEGSLIAMINELGALQDDLLKYVRSGSESEKDYAANLIMLMSIADRGKENAREELEELAETAENPTLRGGIRIALDSIDQMEELTTEEEIEAEGWRAQMELERLKLDGRDPGKINEMEEALRRRMQGE